MLHFARFARGHWGQMKQLSFGFYNQVAFIIPWNNAMSMASEYGVVQKLVKQIKLETPQSGQ